MRITIHGQRSTAQEANEVSNEITESDIAEALTRTEQLYGSVLLNFPDEAWEQNATVLREALCSQGLDPADRTVQHTGMVTSFIALSHIINTFAVIGTALPLAYLQVQVFRRWMDGSIPVMSLADYAGLKALEAMDPRPCEYVHTYEGGTSDCSRRGHHSSHYCSETHVDENGWPTVSMREIEAE